MFEKKRLEFKGGPLGKVQALSRGFYRGIDGDKTRLIVNQIIEHSRRVRVRKLPIGRLLFEGQLNLR